MLHMPAVTGVTNAPQRMIGILQVEQKEEVPCKG